MTWVLDQFSQTLESLCNQYGSRLIRISREYTSKTSSKCGDIHSKLSGDKLLKCPVILMEPWRFSSKLCGIAIPPSPTPLVMLYLMSRMSQNV